MCSPHFILFPLLAQGHMIPMVDLAKLLAQRGAITTIVTTPLNAARYRSALAQAKETGLQIHLVQLQFPWKEAGLPEGCENFDLLPSFVPPIKLFRAACLLYEPSEKLLEQLSPLPTCIVSDSGLPWTFRLAQKFNIPRLVFHIGSCFYNLCLWSILTNFLLLLSSESEFITLPNVLDPVELRKSDLPRFNDEDMIKFGAEVGEANRQSYGVIITSFEELEPEYLSEYRKTTTSPDKVWCVGPVSLCNENELERGNKASISGHECINWLDGQQPTSVVYVSFGSVCDLETAQLIELGLGLEASNKPFIWVIRNENMTEELQKWLEYDFERKTKGRGLVISGWAPQVLILSHNAIACFLTHCGWNSTIEAISAGVPMITWPLVGDQFFNAIQVVQILRIGVSVDEARSIRWQGKEERGEMVKKEKVREAIEMVMDGDEREEMGKRCKRLAEMAKRSVIKEGGSSHRNITLLIEEIIAYRGDSEY